MLGITPHCGWKNTGTTTQGAFVRFDVSLAVAAACAIVNTQ